MSEVAVARPEERRDVVRALAVAFADDPIVRWLLPRGRRVEGLFAVLVRWVHAADDGAWIARDGSDVVGAALWDPPGHRPGLANTLLADLAFGPVLRTHVGRGLALERSFAAHRPAGRQDYLATLGAVVPGRGVGSALLEAGLAGVTGPAYLESSNERNLPLYERYGFEVLDEVVLPHGGPPYWPMLRA